MDANRQAAALDALEALVGADGVTRDPAALAPFHSGVALPLGIIAPRDTEQLAKVLAVASEAGAALQPVCRAVAGQEVAARDKIILLDLGRMNEILEINENLAYCLVEPEIKRASCRGRGGQ